MNKAYIINFDVGVFSNHQKFHNKLTTAKGIISWWHYLESSYIIITNSNTSATNVSEFVKSNLPDNKHFFVCELNLGNHNGWLPQEAWDWINKYKPFNYY